MRVLLIFISFFLISCENDMDCCDMPSVFKMELRYDGDRLEFSRVSVLSTPASSPAIPDYSSDISSNNESFEVYGLKNTEDVYVTLTFFCTADGEFYTKEVKADFFDDKITVLLIEKVIGCEPTIEVIYE